uniref:Uncharacterized protein n=1 Tax=Cannabis sativa TaxID=3483 RepID=A0A803NKV8_CANSA
MILWGVWHAQNDVVWNNKSSTMDGVVSVTITYIDHWRIAQQEETLVSTTPVNGALSNEHWTKLSGEIKVICDVAIFEAGNSFRVGWIAQIVMVSLLKSVKKFGQLDSHVAKALSLKEVLS